MHELGLHVDWTTVNAFRSNVSEGVRPRTTLPVKKTRRFVDAQIDGARSSIFELWPEGSIAGERGEREGSREHERIYSVGTRAQFMRRMRSLISAPRFPASFASKYSLRFLLKASVGGESLKGQRKLLTSLKCGPAV